MNRAHNEVVKDLETSSMFPQIDISVAPNFDSRLSKGKSLLNLVGISLKIATTLGQ